MADESEYYRAQPLPPREGQNQWGAQHGPYGGGPQWGQPGPAGQPVNVNVVGGKSVVIAYVLWFFLGQLGIHKFYLGQPFQGLFYLVLGAAGWAMAPIVIGWFLLVPLFLLLLLDLFLIPLRVGVLNARLARRAGGY